MDTWLGEKLKCFLEFLDSDLIRYLRFSRWRLAQDILKNGGDAVDKLKNFLENPTAFGNLQDILKNGGDTVDKFKNFLRILLKNGADTVDKLEKLLKNPTAFGFYKI